MSRTAIGRASCWLKKGVEIDIINVVPGRYPEDLLDLNPYHSLPTLVDRDLVLYDSRVIIEYLDERFPHPPLMPVDPILRAQFRLALYRIERDWYGLAQQIDEDHDKKHAARNKKVLRDAILQSADVFKVKPLFPERRILAGGCQHRRRYSGGCAATRSICRRRRRRWPNMRARCSPDPRSAASLSDAEIEMRAG